MNTILRWLFNIPFEDIPDNTEIKLKFTALSSGNATWIWGLVGILGLSIIYFIYYKEGAYLRKIHRYILFALRMAVFAIVLFISLEPVLMYEFKDRTDAAVGLLIDKSLSMSFNDAYDDKDLLREIVGVTGLKISEHGNKITRASIVDSVLTGTKLDLLQRLRKKNRLHIYSFSQKLQPVAFYNKITNDYKREKTQWEPLIPDGNCTNIGGAILQALDELRGMKIAGLVLITDGCSNTGPSPQISAETAGKRTPGVPIYAIGIGNPSHPKNVKIRSVFSRDVAYQNDPIPFYVQLESQGYDGIPVHIFLERKEKNEKDFHEVIKKTITLTSNRGVQEVVLTDKTPPPLGEYIYKVHIPSLHGEATEEDNQKERAVRVVDERCKILLISGGPTYEYRFLKNFLLREKTLKLSVWLQSADSEWPQEGTLRLAKFPAEIQELREYDLIMLLDPNPAKGMDHFWYESLKKCVEKDGAGLLFIAGEKYTESLLTLSEFASLQSILPVKADRAALEEMVKTYTKVYKFLLTQEGMTHPITSSDEAGKDEKNWENLPGFYWFFPVIKANPLARVLIEQKNFDERTIDGNVRPLAVLQFYGPGRVMFLAFDSTYLWISTHKRQYEQFWLQTIRYMTEGKLLKSQKRARISTNKESYLFGEDIVIQASVMDETRQFPLISENIDAILYLPDGKKKKVILNGSGEGSFEGRYCADQKGTITIGLWNIPQSQVDEKIIHVNQGTLEMRSIQMDVATIEDIVRNSGGKFIKFSELNQLPDIIEDLSEVIIRPGPNKIIWDSPITLILFFTLLTLEWWIRKKSHLV